MWFYLAIMQLTCVFFLCIFVEKETIPTMGDILNQIIPELFVSEKARLDPQVAVVLHGVHLPLDTPVNWAYENLSFADNFLHVVVTFKKETQ
jgi:hypothetical protein